MLRENVIVPLPEFRLPVDFAWRIGFVSLVDDQLRRLRATGHFLPPRFFGYYCQRQVPVAIAGSWTVSLDPVAPASLLSSLVDDATDGRYSITAPRRDLKPEFMLVHDRRDGACWLWTFADALRFIEAVEPTSVDALRE